LVYTLTLIRILFSFYPHPNHRHLHSFPTRRSSDLTALRTHWRFYHRKSSTWLFPSNYRKDRPIDTKTVWYACQKAAQRAGLQKRDRKSTRLNSSHVSISYAVFCLKKKKANRRSD